MYQFKTREEFIEFIREKIMTTAEVEEYLGVTRQAINSLVKRGKLTPIKGDKSIKLFWRPDVESRKIEAEELRKKYRPYE